MEQVILRVTLVADEEQGPGATAGQPAQPGARGAAVVDSPAESPARVAYARVYGPNGLEIVPVRNPGPAELRDLEGKRQDERAKEQADADQALHLSPQFLQARSGVIGAHGYMAARAAAALARVSAGKKNTFGPAALQAAGLFATVAGGAWAVENLVPATVSALGAGAGLAPGGKADRSVDAIANYIAGLRGRLSGAWEGAGKTFEFAKAAAALGGDVSALEPQRSWEEWVGATARWLIEMTGAELPDRQHQAFIARGRIHDGASLATMYAEIQEADTLAESIFSRANARRMGEQLGRSLFGR